jgi:hypothetical protein
MKYVYIFSFLFNLIALFIFVFMSYCAGYSALQGENLLTLITLSTAPMIVIIIMLIKSLHHSSVIMLSLLSSIGLIFHGLFIQQIIIIILHAGLGITTQERWLMFCFILLTILNFLIFHQQHNPSHVNKKFKW